MKLVVASACAILTAAGLAQPELAGRAIQLLVTGTTIAVVITVAHGHWEGVAPRAATPFVPPEPEPSPGVETPDVTELRKAIETSRGRLPPLVARHLAEVCRGRLTDRHRLHADAQGDREAIRGLISPAMWTVLLGEPEEVADVPIRSLRRLLDEMEAL